MVTPTLTGGGADATAVSSDELRAGSVASAIVSIQHQLHAAAAARGPKSANRVAKRRTATSPAASILSRRLRRPPRSWVGSPHQEDTSPLPSRRSSAV